MATALFVDEFEGSGALIGHISESGGQWLSGSGAGSIVLNGAGRIVPSGGAAFCYSNFYFPANYVLTAVITTRETSSVSEATILCRTSGGLEVWELRAKSNSFFGAACNLVIYNAAGVQFGSPNITDLNTSAAGTHYNEEHKYQLRVSLDGMRYELFIDDVLRATVNITGTPRVGRLGVYIAPLTANPPHNMSRLVVGDGADLTEPVLNTGLSSYAAAPSMLGLPSVLASHDFTQQLGAAVNYYAMDLLTPGGTLRVPMSSWQATLQTGSAGYVQCVIPACQPWVEAINTATEFVIYRLAEVPGAALAIEYEMARGPAELAQFDRGPDRYTCTLSGYPQAFAAEIDPPVAYDRTLAGVRAVSQGSKLRVRCAVDWFLRPGQRAYLGALPFVVSYINYYALESDSYMDVGD